MKCPNCNGSRSVKNGKRLNKQLYKCKSCGFRFSGLTIKRSTNDYFKVKACQLWLEGLNYKIIGHILNCDQETISRWIKPYEMALNKIRLQRPTNGVQVSAMENIVLVDQFDKPLYGGGVFFKCNKEMDSEILVVSRKPMIT